MFTAINGIGRANFLSVDGNFDVDSTVVAEMSG
jgi:hypothetical protein